MATKLIKFTTSVIYNAEFGSTSVAIRFQGDSVDVAPGDTVQFKWESQTGANPAPTISGFSSSVFTSTAFLNFGSVGQVLSKTVKSNASFITDGVTVAGSYNGVNDSDNINIRVLNPTDNTPDSFNLGSNRTGAPPGSEFIVSQVFCRGVNVGVTCSISNTSYYRFRVNGGSWRTASQTVYNGDRIELRVTTPTSFSNTQSCTLSMGPTSDSISVTTGNEDSIKFIPFPVTSLPVSLSEIGDFFGQYPVPSSSAAFEDPFLSHYVRGGDFVPNITENNGLPTAPPISLSQFTSGVGTSFYFETFPQSKGAGANVVSSGQTMVLAWTESIDFKMGYGYVGERAEYRITLKRYEVGTGSSGNGSLSLSGVDYTIGTWSTGGFSISVSLPVSAGGEGFADGELLMESRVFGDNTTIVEAVIPFSFGWYGN
jgi:plastocyanin